MALQPNVIPISFSQGLDTKTDPKQVIIGKLTNLNNGRFTSLKRIKKRFGYTVLSQTIATGGSIASGVSLDSYNNELLMLDGFSIYSYSSSTSNWSNKGTLPLATFSVQSIIKNNNQQTTQDSALHSSGLQVFTWEDSSGGVRYSVIDNSTNQTLVNNALVSSTGNRSKVILISTNFVIIFYDTSVARLRYKAISTSTPTTLGSVVDIATDINQTNTNYDAELIDSNLYIVYNRATANISGYYLNSALTLSSQFTQAGENANSCITVFGDGSNNVWVGYHNGSAVKLFIQQPSFGGSILAPTTVETINSVRNITGIVSGSTGTLYYEIDQNTSFLTSTAPSAFYGNYIKSNTCTSGGSVGSAVVFVRSLGLISKVFSFNSINYFLGVYYSTSQLIQGNFTQTLEPTYFLMNSNAQVVAKIAPLNAGGLTTRSLLCEVNNLSSGQYIIPYLIKDLVSASNGVIYTQTGINSANINFNNSAAPIDIVLGDNIHYSGSLIQMYDGGSSVEHSYNVFPDNVYGSFGVSYAGSLSSGSYQWCSTYEWTDNQGQIHRSAPSTPITLNVGNSTNPYVTFGDTHTTTTIDSIPTGNAFDGASGEFYVSGSNIPSNSLISTVSYNSGTDKFSITIPSAATGSATQQQITITPAFTITATTNAGATYGSNLITISNPQRRNVPFLTTTTVSGSNKATVVDSSNLIPGMQLSFASVGFKYFPASTVITAISGNTITLNNNAISSGTAVIEYKLGSGALTCNTQSGSATISNIKTAAGALIPVSYFRVGDSLQTASVNSYIISIDTVAQTVTLAATAGSTATNTNIVALQLILTRFLSIGNIIAVAPTSDFTVGTSINGLSYNSTTNVLTITLSAPALTTNSAAQAIIQNVYSANITVPTLRLTQKSNVRIVLYRTQVNGTTFYRTTSITAPIVNDQTVDSVSITDLTSDQVLIGNDQLYTTGGVISNISAPAMNSIVSYKNRLVGVPVENNNSWIYSQQVIPGTPVSFNPLLFVENIDQKIGSISALGVMDDKLIFFGPKSMFYVVGEGPSSAGTDNDFTEPILISSDTGCSNQDSIVIMPMGLMFQSPKGIYLLDRSLGVEYIGADIESLNSYTVTSAKLNSTRNEVKFTFSNGQCAVYDYFVRQWSIDSNISAIDSNIYNSTYYYLKSNGQVNQESSSLFTDNGSFVQLSLTTNWMSLAGIQGRQRVWKLNILGDYKSSHTLQVKTYSDFSSTADQTSNIPVTSDPGVYQYRIHLKKQKCEALQLLIQDNQSSGFGEGFDISDISLEFGIKTGIQKISAGGSFG